MDYLYEKQIIHQKIKVPFYKVGNDMEKYFISYLEVHVLGKCRNEGYIHPNTSDKPCSLVNYSAGLLQGNDVFYDVRYQVYLCLPYESMEIDCIIKNINKIGIRAIISEENNPMNIFISKEYNKEVNMDKYNEGDTIKIKVLGHRFEINDTFISIIGEII
jgi:DNA-directed RNA polymerase subunit E'/Rpb7|tara:strand:+ start:195 stop:674 length:480 start_codon:yes stop_codon:yes gene_type:complete